MDTATAAAVARVALEDLPPDGEIPAFEVWRERVRERFRHPAFAGLPDREAKM
jgi:hypothetical protein